MTKSSLVTRFAPTPNGYLHLGNFYHLVWVSLLARKRGAEIGLRIDDYDQARYRTRFVDDIFRVLERVGFVWQHGPTLTQEFESSYSSRHRRELYQQAAQALKNSSKTYWCTCTRKMQSGPIYSGRCRHLGHDELSMTADKLPAQLRFALQPDELLESIGDVIVVPRHDEIAYHLGSIVDDVHFGYNLLIRGEDLRLSSEAQLEMCIEMNRGEFQKTQFVHHPLLKHVHGAKLSKSQKSPAVLELLQTPNGLASVLEGFSRTQLGWQGAGKCPDTLDEFCQLFKSVV